MTFLKNIFVILLISSCVHANDYYEKARGLKGYQLKSALSKIIENGHRSRDYSDLIEAYVLTDSDTIYEKDGSVLDMYSERPHHTDSYNFSHFQKKCGNNNVGEAHCYNREHLFPQGSFGKRKPMKTDIFHVFPTDGYVNRQRSNYPFGEVKNPSWRSENGSQVGYNSDLGHNGPVFEPIDEFKGDIARAMFYFATRYENKVKSFRHKAMLNGSKNQVFKTWFLNVLLRWHKQDPVSQYEKNRNEQGYKFQGNRNPFIDHPEFVEAIWE